MATFINQVNRRSYAAHTCKAAMTTVALFNITIMITTCWHALRGLDEDVDHMPTLIEFGIMAGKILVQSLSKQLEDNNRKNQSHPIRRR